jgi:hypothetical protein
MPMTRIIIAAFVALTLVGPVKADEGRLYQCSVKSITELGASGLMEENASTSGWLKRTVETITFDEASGILRRGGVTREMTLIQRGTQDNSTVGLYVYNGAGSGGADVFRIRTWKANMPFLFLDTDTLFTGYCKVL